MEIHSEFDWVHSSKAKFNGFLLPPLWLDGE
jgi:hypothetical protein